MSIVTVWLSVKFFMGWADTTLFCILESIVWIFCGGLFLFSVSGKKWPVFGLDNEDGRLWFLMFKKPSILLISFKFALDELSSTRSKLVQSIGLTTEPLTLLASGGSFLFCLPDKLLDLLYACFNGYELFRINCLAKNYRKKSK